MTCQDPVTRFALQFGFEPVLMLMMGDGKVAHFRMPPNAGRRQSRP